MKIHKGVLVTPEQMARDYNPNPGSWKITLADPSQCMCGGIGLIMIGMPNGADLCPGVGCSARDDWERNKFGRMVRKSQ